MGAHGPLSQPVEDEGLNPLCCGFESHKGYASPRIPTGRGLRLRPEEVHVRIMSWAREPLEPWRVASAGRPPKALSLIRSITAVQLPVKESSVGSNPTGSAQVGCTCILECLYLQLAAEGMLSGSIQCQRKRQRCTSSAYFCLHSSAEEHWPSKP